MNKFYNSRVEEWVWVKHTKLAGSKRNVSYGFSIKGWTFVISDNVLEFK